VVWTHEDYCQILNEFRLDVSVLDQVWRLLGEL